ncbi:MAG: glycoside hydrolase family 1 protein [Beutenbergiaceae bacterium]
MTISLPRQFIFGATSPESAHQDHTQIDVDLMATLRLDGFRFTLNWARIQPDGCAPVPESGLDPYDELVDRLLGAGIEPMVTLHHHELPVALAAAGGWQRRETAQRFGDYAQTVADRMADRVAYWCPINEPNADTVAGIHHRLLAHGLAVAALRAAGAAAIGSANHHSPVWAADDDAPTQHAASWYDTLHNHAVADPMLTGQYPAGLADRMPTQPGDLAAISSPLDFYGINYYRPTLVGAPHPDPYIRGSAALPVSILPIDGYQRTEVGWPVVPHGLHELLVSLDRRYPHLPAIHVTENGCVHAGLNDIPRIDFLNGHLNAVAVANSEGINVAGYWSHSLSDTLTPHNHPHYQWGLVHVDERSGWRTPRASYQWYRQRIAEHRRAP